MNRDSLFLVGLALLILEFILCFTWYKPYFRYGFPIFWTRLDLPADAFANMSADKVETIASANGLSKLTFESITDSKIAFREALVQDQRHYPPVMHGNLLIDPGRRRAVIVGKLNWLSLSGFVIFSLIIMESFGWAFSLIALAAVLFLFFKQVKDYLQLANILGEQKV